MKGDYTKARLYIEQGYAYSEIRDLTGIDPYIIAKQGRKMEAQGIHVVKKTPEERRRSMVRQMQTGRVKECLDQLSLEELEWVMGRSFTSWSDALANTIKEAYSDSIDGRQSNHEVLAERHDANASASGS